MIFTSYVDQSAYMNFRQEGLRHLDFQFTLADKKPACHLFPWIQALFYSPEMSR